MSNQNTLSFVTMLLRKLEYSMYSVNNLTVKSQNKLQMAKLNISALINMYKQKPVYMYLLP